MNPYRYRQILLAHRALDKRKQPTKAESIAWQIAHNINESRFRFQKTLLNDYIVDLFHVPSNTIIEIDGSYHDIPSVKQYDKKRQLRLKQHGYKILRFRNEEVKTKYFQEAIACLDFAHGLPKYEPNIKTNKGFRTGYTK